MRRGAAGSFTFPAERVNGRERGRSAPASCICYGKLETNGEGGLLSLSPLEARKPNHFVSFRGRQAYDGPPPILRCTEYEVRGSVSSTSPCQRPRALPAGAILGGSGRRKGGEGRAQGPLAGPAAVPTVI